MSIQKNLYLLGYASGIAGSSPGSGEGPVALQQSVFMAQLPAQGVSTQWKNIIKFNNLSVKGRYQITAELCQQLATDTADLTNHHQRFMVLGGDHSCAIGTWSGVSAAKQSAGPIGLIWIDAHMDSHTPETSPTGNIHGMPLACLLGYGDDQLTKIANDFPKLNPEHVCLIGIRSYEAGEAELLKKLNIRIFYMDEVKQRGMKAVMAEAVQRVSKDTVGYGVTIDIDSMDPQDAPGTGTVEPDGIRAEDLRQALCQLATDSHFLAAEICEFDPTFDTNQITEKLIPRLISAITVGK